MKKATTAILLSALIIPGAGHFYLKKKLSAAILLSVTLVALYILVTTAIEKALLITDKILNGEVLPDITAITELAASQLASTDSMNVNLATTAFVIAWLIGIADSYRLGKKMELMETKSG